MSPGHPYALAYKTFDLKTSRSENQPTSVLKTQGHSGGQASTRCWASLLVGPSLQLL